MRNKVIVVLSALLIVGIVIYFIYYIINNKNSDNTIRGTETEYHSIYIEDEYDSLYNESGYSPIPTWYTTDSFDHKQEFIYATNLSPYIEGNVTYQLGYIDVQEEELFATHSELLSKVNFDPGTLMDIYTDTDHYIATMDLYKIYWTRVESGVINEVVYN